MQPKLSSPSSAQAHHCVPCGLQETVEHQPISGQTANFERSLVQNYGNMMLNAAGKTVVADTDPDIVSPESQRRHQAALQCATLIIDGKCPLFAFLTDLNGNHHLQPKKDLPKRQRHLRIVN